MFDKDKKEVILAYQKKKEKGALSGNLLNPTPRKLRDECLFVYQERYSTNDDETLRLFFGPKNKDGDYAQIIKKTEVDKFRPLLSILDGDKIKRPSDKNVRLLSWLIDFEKKDSEAEVADEGNGKKTFIDSDNSGNSANMKQEGIISKDEVKEIDVEKKTESASFSMEEGSNKESQGASKIIQTFAGSLDGKPQNQPGSKIKKTVISLALLATAIGGGYFFSSSIDQKCMYWTGDEYQAISCNEKAGDKTIIAMDTEKLTHLKRITQQDTVTKKSIGKVWYFKVNADSIDVFTSPGFHPLNSDRKLMPLTIHMYNKYILHK